MALTVLDVLGEDRLRALRGEGKDDAAITEEVFKVLDPVKNTLGEDVYNGFRKNNISFSDMQRYANYLEEEKVKEAKRKEAEAYQKQVDNYAKTFEEDLKGEDFTDRLNRGAHRVVAEMGAVAQQLTGNEVSPQFQGVLKADEKLGEEFAKKRRTPEQQKIYDEKQQAFADANGTVETIKAGADMLYQKVKNPDEWDMAGLLAEGINPINYVGAGAGGAVAKAGGKVLLAGATGAATDAGAGAVYDYTLERAKGGDEATAEKAATLGVAANLGMGALSGSVTAMVHNKLKAKKSAEVTENTTDDVMVDTANTTDVTLPDEIENARLMQLSDANEHASAAHEIQKDIEAKVPNPQEREVMIAQKIPPTEKEISYSHVLNDNHDVSPSMVGARAGKKLEVTIANAEQYTPEQVSAKLDTYGITGEHKRAMMRAFEARDMSVYDQWASDKYLNKMEESYNADRNRAENTTEQANGADNGTGGARGATATDAEPQSVADVGSGDKQAGSYDGQDTRVSGTSDGIPAIDGELAGQQSARGDEQTLLRARQDTVVQAENGVSTKPSIGSLKEQIASVESRGSYTAQSPTSSAYGKYQFLDATYKEAAKALGTTVEELRSPKGQERAMVWLVNKNAKELEAKGIDATAFHVYGAHQQGVAGFERILKGEPTKKDIINMRNNTPKKYRTGNVRDDWMKYWSSKFKEDKAIVAKDAPMDVVARAEEIANVVDDLLADEPSIVKDLPEQQRVDSGEVPGRSVGDAEGISFDLGAKEDFTPQRIHKREQAIDSLLNSKNNTKMTQTLGNVFKEKVMDVLSFKKGTPVRRIVDNSTIKHIFKKHGDAKVESSRGQVPINKIDIANYPEMVQSADFQTVLTYKNGKRKMVSVRQSKGHYVVVEEVSTKKNTLRLQTMYKKKGKLDERAISHIVGDESHLLTSRNDTVAYTVENMPSSDNSIAKSIEDVKTDAVVDNVEVIDTPTLHDGWDNPLRVEEMAVEIDDALDFFDVPKLETPSVLREVVDDVSLDAAHEKIIANERDPMKREALRAEFEGKKSIWEEEC